MAVAQPEREAGSASVWTRNGAPPDERVALEAYATTAFGVWDPRPLPLHDEPHVAQWATWVDAAAEHGAASVLREHLPQLRFPVAEETQHSDAWLAATRRGLWSGTSHDGPPFASAAGITIELAHSAAGRIPVIVARARSDFEYLQRALCARCAPIPIPPSSGAVMVAGFVNWARVHAARASWAEARGSDDPSAWAVAFARLRADPSQWQDRFILLSAGPYAAVPAAELGLTDAAWQLMSLIIRREHEVAHYVTKRFFGVMRNALHDELLADYAGLVGATGTYPAPWGRRMLGIDERGRLMPGGRLWNYRGTPPLSDRAMQSLSAVASFAIDALAGMDQHRVAAASRLGDVSARTAALLAIAQTPVDVMGGADGREMLCAAFDACASLVAKA